jgi:hypothetical protein
MVSAVVAARLVYSMRFLKFAAVGMVGIIDGEGCSSPRLIYLLLCSLRAFSASLNQMICTRCQCLMILHRKYIICYKCGRCIFLIS